MSEFRERLATGTVVLIAAICVIIVGGAIIVGGWQAGWWFTQQNTARTARMIQNSQYNQASLIQRFASDMQTINTPGFLPAEYIAAGNDACAAADQITNGGLSGYDRQWVKAECAGPTLTRKAITILKSRG